MRLPDYEISAAVKRPFRGLNTVIKNAKEITAGYAADALNWTTAKYGDHIELRRGSALLGLTRQSGSGKITGLGVGVRYDGVEIPFLSYGRKIKYYDSASDDTIVVGGTVYGSTLITNGTFDTTVAGWSFDNFGGAGTFIWSAGTGSVSADVGCIIEQHGISFAADTEYLLEFDLTVSSVGVSGIAPGFVHNPANGLNNLTINETQSLYAIASGHYSATITAADVATYPTMDGIGFFCGAGFAGTIDNVTLRSVGDAQLIASAADGEDTHINAYQNLAGSFVFVGGPDTSSFKIPLANPGSAVDQANASFRFGSFKVGQGRAFAAQRKGTTAGNLDKTGVYLSYIDHPLLSDYTQTTGEAYGTGDGATKTFAHTLTNVAGVKTCMYPSVTDGVETFTDDRNGNMVGSLGGTGTINYATGAVSVTFNGAPANLAAITCSYYVEDSTTHGILDFDTSATGAGKPKIFRQDDGGGNLMAIWPFQNIEYCFHLLKTWALTTALDDTQSTNLTYRNIGIPYPRAAWPEPEGILCIDLSNPNEPKARRLEIQKNTTNLTIVPTSISEVLDLSAYAFDYAVAFRWGDYEIICCQEYMNAVANTFNSVMYIHNVVSGSWDKLDYRASCLAIYNGSLIAGDPISNNVYTLFSGFDDDEEVIENHWQDGQLDLGTENLKRAHFMRITGLIQTEQEIKVSLALDGSNPVEEFTIDGNGSYVDQGIATDIGSYTLGSKVLGGGAGSTTAHPFDVTFPIHTDRFQRISVRFEALGIGYASIDSYEYKDIRDKGRHSLPTKTV